MTIMKTLAATLFCCLAFFVQSSLQDVYMQNPRGSNNRLNEKKDNRQNNNRLFDSQNNNRGGYNVGQNGGDQFQMKYYENSKLRVEWTQQHGCGYSSDGNTQINCNVVLQYMCQKTNDASLLNPLREKLRDGTNTGTNAENAPDADNGLQESADWYEQCKQTNRNKGLFTADQKLKGNAAKFTRQNPGGGRSGYECPEERDYWPYWRATPWNDIAQITSDTCGIRESANVKPKQRCVNFSSKKVQAQSAITEADCLAGKSTGNEWLSVWSYDSKLSQLTTRDECANHPDGLWGLPWDLTSNQPECLKLARAPECVRAQKSRENHLGQTTERDGRGTNTYDWQLPTFDDQEPRTCVLRLRYNITSNTYDRRNTYASSNNDKNVIANNPKVLLGPQTLQLNINTNQVGRVFQDRSHTFQILPRAGTSIGKLDRVVNLNVRGRRGNIVQTFPATEYDFVPQYVSLNSTQDVLHVQWTGSDTNPQGNDRNNMVLTNQNNDYPKPFEGSSFMKRVKDFDYLDAKTGSLVPSSTKARKSKADLGLYLTTSGHFHCVAGCEKKFDNQLDGKLQKATASMPGALIKFDKGKSERFYIMSTINNDFSNRRQLGVIDLLF
jgi:hypothetical protein